MPRLFLGSLIALIVCCLGFADDPSPRTQSDHVTILMIGDSTMASYAKPPADRPTLTGWGQVFGELFTDRVEVVNKARSGRSSKSFIAEGAWKDALETHADYVFIQFGHNDQPGKGDRTTNPEGDFRDFLKRYIADARAAGMKPILVTPVARRTYVAGKVQSSLGPYVKAVKAVGLEQQVPVIDLHEASFQLFDTLGDEKSSDLSASASDRTHFSRKGAQAIARLVADRVPESLPELKSLRKK
jgi:lysophospholipase L1-like esterase